MVLVSPVLTSLEAEVGLKLLFLVSGTGGEKAAGVLSLRGALTGLCSGR